MASKLDEAEALRVLVVRRLYSYQVSQGLVPFLKMEPEMSQLFITEQARNDPVTLAAIMQNLCNTLSSITCADVDPDSMDESQLRSHCAQVYDLLCKVQKTGWGRVHMQNPNTPMPVLSLQESDDAYSDLQYLRLLYAAIHDFPFDYPKSSVRNPQCTGELCDYFEDFRKWDVRYVLEERIRMYLNICAAKHEREVFWTASLGECLKYGPEWCELKLTEHLYMPRYWNFNRVISAFSCCFAIVHSVRMLSEPLQHVDVSNVRHVAIMSNGICSMVIKKMDEHAAWINSEELSTLRALLPYVMPDLVQDDFWAVDPDNLNIYSWDGSDVPDDSLIERLFEEMKKK